MTSPCPGVLTPHSSYVWCISTELGVAVTSPQGSTPLILLAAAYIHGDWLYVWSESYTNFTYLRALKICSSKS
jgi:hypothetical protein